jgi:hypothetical protein
LFYGNALLGASDLQTRLSCGRPGRILRGPAELNMKPTPGFKKKKRTGFKKKKENENNTKHAPGY